MRSAAKYRQADVVVVPLRSARAAKVKWSKPSKRAARWSPRPWRPGSRGIEPTPFKLDDTADQLAPRCCSGCSPNQSVASHPRVRPREVARPRPPGVHAELMRYPAVTILTAALSTVSLK
jgi:hypothetical protein